VALDFSGQPYDPFTSKSIVVGPSAHVERVLHCGVRAVFSLKGEYGV